VIDRGKSFRSGLVATTLLATLAMTPQALTAQESRAAIIAAAQAEKATRLAPRVPSAAERLLVGLSGSLVEQPSGFFPYFDSVYSGGGFTLGGGYRLYTGDRTNVALAGLYSIKSYKLIEATTSSRGHFEGRLDFDGRAGWRDATQVSYYGLGIESTLDDKVAFRLQQTYAGADVTVRPHPVVVFRAGATFEDYTVKAPSGSLPSVEDVHTSVTAPGVGVDPTYVHTAVSAGIDWRPAADYARRGGLYAVTHHAFMDRDETYSFNRLDADLVQHIPILRETWVISMRGALRTTTGDDDQVPYFLLPALGSGSTLRGYGSWRFRDRHSALTSGEFRWIPNRLAMDMAIFYDAGMVAPELDQISFGSFVSDYGFGVRFHGPLTTPLRIEIARGREGTRLVFAGSSAF